MNEELTNEEILNLIGARQVAILPPHFHVKTFRVKNIATFEMNVSALTRELQNEFKNRRFLSKEIVVAEATDWILTNLVGRFYIDKSSPARFGETDFTVGFESERELTFFTLNIKSI